MTGRHAARPEPHDAQAYYRVTRSDGTSIATVLNAEGVARMEAQGCTVTPWWVPSTGVAPAGGDAA